MVKVYETNSGLGYNQMAYLIQAGEGYLVIDILNIPLNDYYVIGKIVELEKYEITESSYSIDDSPLKGKYLFEYFLQHFNFNNN